MADDSASPNTPEGQSAIAPPVMYTRFSRLLLVGFGITAAVVAGAFSIDRILQLVRAESGGIPYGQIVVVAMFGLLAQAAL